ncbi:nucleolar transcription factor 1-like isoform X1 [Portunus trituberculatus]|uniref:nucleolar transcription factor 1-like isoform X1 n=2 Tax=Portunus trituberculatus TaxID=210409 RepID=UPI001E1CEF77|nr:nucleolar transcription factor 1-like isoform X1 [Portunus trituberculatus]
MLSRSNLSSSVLCCVVQDLHPTMESNGDNTNQIKEKEKLVSQNSSVLADIVISFSSSSDSEEEQDPSLIAIKKPSWSLLQTSFSTTNNSKIHSTWTKDLQEQTDNAKAASQSRKIQGSKLIDPGLDNTSASSSTDLEGPSGCTSTATSPQHKDNPFKSKPWSVTDITHLLEKMQNQLPKLDKKSCLYTAKKINWNKIAFDIFTAEDCKKAFEFLLTNIKLVKTMTAVISELKEKIPSGKLKASLILQPRQQFVRDFADKNKGLVSGIDLFAASAEAWKKLPPEEKEQYRKDYILAKEKEIARMCGDEPPVQPRIPFELYYEELCNKKGKKNLDLKATARKKYKNLSLKKKLKYISLSAIELYTFELQAAKYLVKHPDWTVPARKGPSKEDCEMYLRSLDMPTRPPNRASLLYYHKKLKEGKFDNIPGTRRLFHATEQFRNLPDNKKRKYKERHKQMVQEYTVEYENWKKSQNDIVRSLADRFLGRKQVLPSGTLCWLQESSRKREETVLSEPRSEKKDTLSWEARWSCCRERSECEPAESSDNKNLVSSEIQKLRQICKQEVFFNVNQPLEARMEKIMLMLSGYEYLPNKVRQNFDSTLKKWKYTLQASIINDVRRLDTYEQQEFLLKYRSVCKRFFKCDIFNVFPTDK